MNDYKAREDWRHARWESGRAFWHGIRLQFLQRAAVALAIVAVLKMAGWL
jgi:hypothetical protein